LARLRGSPRSCAKNEVDCLDEIQSSVKSAFAPRGIRMRLGMRPVIVIDAQPAKARICPAGPPTTILTIEAVRLPTAITARRVYT